MRPASDGKKIKHSIAVENHSKIWVGPRVKCLNFETETAKTGACGQGRSDQGRSDQGKQGPSMQTSGFFLHMTSPFRGNNHSLKPKIS